MNAILPEELRQALSLKPEQPLEVEDPVTHARYVLLKVEMFERLQQALELDLSDPDPRDFYPTFAEAVKEHLDSPEMEAYNDDGTSQDKT